jgi:hypothetical protein
MKHDPWNRCDVCGRFIPLDDFPDRAVRALITPDSEFSREEWETLCKEHSGLKARLEA